MPIEIQMLLAALALLLVLTNVVQVGAFIATYGFGKALGSRGDVPYPQPGFGGRVQRAIDNLKENLHYFIPLCLLTLILGVSNPMTAIGAQLFVVCRIAHAALYLAGIPVVRTMAFVGSMTGVMMMALGLFRISLI